MISMNRKMIRLPNAAISQRTTPKDQLSKKAQRGYNNVQIHRISIVYCRLYRFFFYLMDERKNASAKPFVHHV